MINTSNEDASILEKKNLRIKQVLGAWWRLLRSTSLPLLSANRYSSCPISRKKGNSRHFPALTSQLLLYSPYCLLPSIQRKGLSFPSPRPLFSGIFCLPLTLGFLPNRIPSPKTLPPLPCVQPNTPEKCLPLLAVLPL